MVAPGIPSPTRESAITTLRVSAFAVTATSGICAAIALAVGTPLEFGVTLALCAGSLIAVDFIESSTEVARPARRHAAAFAQFNRTYHPCRVVFAGREQPTGPVGYRTATRYR